MATVHVDFPEDVCQALRLTPEALPREARLAAAIQWHQQGLVSSSKAAEIAGMHRMDFLQELARRKIDTVHVDLDDLKRELARG